MNVAKYCSSLIFVCLLAACGGSGSEPEQVEITSFFEATGGTLNYADKLGMSFMIGYRSDTLPTNEVKVSIEGPDGWNAERELVRYYKAEKGETEVTWTNYFEDADEVEQAVVAGNYTASIVLGDETLTDTFSINADSILPKVEDITITSLTNDDLTVKWTGTPSAQSYLLEVFGTSSGSLSKKLYTYATTPEASLQNMGLEPSGNYVVGITALSAEVSDDMTEVPDAQFNVSYIGLAFSVPE